MKEDLHSAQFLTIKNPIWGISLVDINDDDGTITEVLDTLVNGYIYIYIRLFFDIINYLFSVNKYSARTVKLKHLYCYRISYFLLV